MPELILPDWIGAPAAVGAFSTGRCGGVSPTPFDDGSGSGAGGFNLGIKSGEAPEFILQNRLLLRAHLPAEPVWLEQVHGATVIDAALAVGATVPPPADASFTSKPGVVCVVTTADCLPVLFCDASGQVVGAAHAGWRGLAAGVLQNTIAAMQSAGARDLMAWLGPAIGPTSFEVGADVHAAFTVHDPRCSAAFRPLPDQPGKYFANLYHLARLILADNGVRRIAGGAFCTASQPQQFFSYRRDYRTGRMASLIWIK
ncbi:MAG: peptidoglycan editing factor PgeF [Herminiimonas sp.]|nr:peptidoglycan editing factor PgeF [Herminiimonas sp.]